MLPVNGIFHADGDRSLEMSEKLLRCHGLFTSLVMR